MPAITVVELSDCSPARNRSRRIDELFRRESLRNYLVRIERHRHLLAAIREILPASLGTHCSDCVADERTLILYVESASWAAQLRFHLPKIVGELSAREVAQFRRAKVRILPLLPNSRPPDRRRTRLPSTTVIDMVEDSAATADEEIKSALLRLTRTLRRASL